MDSSSEARKDINIYIKISIEQTWDIFGKKDFITDKKNPEKWSQRRLKKTEILVKTGKSNV